MLDRAGDSEIEVEDDDDLGEDDLEDGEQLEQDEKWTAQPSRAFSLSDCVVW